MEGAGSRGEIRNQAAAADSPRFRPRFPWITGDLQTVRNMIVRPRPSFADAPAQRLVFAMEDGTGDALLGDLHLPKGADARPLAVLVHGLTGCSESYYVLATARHLLDLGLPVLRLNLRGAGPSAGTCREQYYAGRTGDMRRVLAALDARLARNGVVAVGYSLGGNLLLKMLAEDGAGASLRRAAAVSPPADLASAARCIQRPRNFLYMRYLLARMKEEARASRGGLPDALAEATQAARSVVEFDDRVVAPCYGFASAEDYYARCSAQAGIGGVRVPTLVIQSLDDPWIPAQPFLDPAWQANPRLRLALSERGGHVGFHGAGGRIPWHDTLIGQFFLSE